MLAATPDEGYAACCGAIEHMDLDRRAGRRSARRRSSSPAATTRPRRPSTPSGSSAGIAGARLELVDAAHLATIEQPRAMSELIAGHLLT